jgi:hypothetical protein
MLSWLTGATPARAVVFLLGGGGAKPEATLERLQDAGVSKVEAKPASRG